MEKKFQDLLSYSPYSLFARSIANDSLGVKDEKRHIDQRGMLTRRLTLAIESFRSQSDQLYRLINVEFL